MSGSAGSLISLYALYVLLPTLLGAAAGALCFPKNRLKAGLVGAAIGCVAGQSLMLGLATVE
jgi:hypothetical protein